MKTSINFKAAKSDSETHNFRKKTFDYIRKELTPKNEYWMEEKISDRIQKIEIYCKEKSGRKLQKNAIPVREAVVVIKEDTNLQDLHQLAKRLEEELKIRIFQIAIHKDEGHYDKDTKEWKPNYHAHLVADWQDLKTGKTLKHQSFHYSKMQDLAAECLGMERGISGSKSRLEAIEFKIQKKEEDFKALEEKYNEMKSEINSKKFEDLIVKESDFLGFKHIRTDKTIDNYEKTFKVYNHMLLKNKEELQSKTKQITELQVQNKELKKEVSFLKYKTNSILTNANIHSVEKDKYLQMVINALERTIKSERFRNSHFKHLSDSQEMIKEMSGICKKLSKENNIPVSAFEEIFKDSDKSIRFFSLLRLGNSDTNYNDEDIPIQKKKRRRRL